MAAFGSHGVAFKIRSVVSLRKTRPHGHAPITNRYGCLLLVEFLRMKHLVVVAPLGSSCRSGDRKSAILARRPSPRWRPVLASAKRRAGGSFSVLAASPVLPQMTRMRVFCPSLLGFLRFVVLCTRKQSAQDGLSLRRNGAATTSSRQERSQSRCVDQLPNRSQAASQRPTGGRTAVLRLGGLYGPDGLYAALRASAAMAVVASWAIAIK